jgi:sugar transferase (PEP-CTERM/EpsH1 system associated)
MSIGFNAPNEVLTMPQSSVNHLLCLSHRIPYPPTKGEKSRLWNFLRRMLDDYTVHLGCFIDDPVDWGQADFLRKRCASSLFLPLNRTRGKLRSLGGLLAGEALTMRYFFDSRMAAWVNQTRQRFCPRRVYVLCTGVGSYIMNNTWNGTRRVIDMMDVDSDKWRQYADRKRGVASIFYGREARTLLAFESRAAECFDATLFVSEADAELFRKLSPRTAGKVHSIRQGVDADYFDPRRDYEAPYPNSEEPIVFTGNMDYWPNVDAVSWFANDVFPRIRVRRPRAAFYIVGANPAREVLALQDQAGVTVTGRVSDIRPYMAHSKVMVAPLRVARGIQSKVLEAMAMAKPVIVTRLAREGIQAKPGSELVVADQPESFARAVVDALEGNGTPLGVQARELVQREYSWDASYTRLRELLEA